MTAALYGPQGFYRRPAGPLAHFSTSATRPEVLAAGLLTLADGVDEALGRPAGFTVVDVGAGHGELLSALAALAPARWSLVAVEVAARPAGVADRVRWTSTAPTGVVGLLLAHELLDVVPVDVVVVTDDGPRLVLVGADGVESDGPPPTGADLAWLERWWPLPTVGAQAEVGAPRDAVWRSLVAGLAAGAALAVDYDHGLGRRPPVGTLTGYRQGRQVRPVPDSSCDLTAHVALDACAAAAADLVDDTWTGRQHTALRLLGVAQDDSSPALDPLGPGGFGWLLQTVGVALPAALGRGG